MAKKFLVLVLAFVGAGGVFAAEGGKFNVSAGVLGNFTGLFGSMKLELPAPIGDKEEKYSIIGGGASAFLDLTYAELGLGLNLVNQKSDSDGDDGTDFTWFSISLLGKYPFVLNDKMSVFPLVGFNWNIFLSGKNKNYDKEIKRDDLSDDYKDSFDAFILDLGGGADFALTEKLYLRASALFGIKFNSKEEQDFIDNSDGKGKIFTAGPTIKVGIGYKF